MATSVSKKFVGPKKPGRNKLHVVKGDKVKVIAGKDKGVVAEIIAVYPNRQKVTVQGVNLMKRHLRSQQNQPQGSRRDGGIVTSEAPIHVSNVQLVVSVDGKEVPTRVGYERVDLTGKDSSEKAVRVGGDKISRFRSVRIARKTNEEI